MLSARVFATFIAVPLLGASPNGSASIDDRITAAVAKQAARLPAGAAVGVIRNGKLVYVKAFGMRDIAGHKLVDADTRFEIGSVTKQFTAAAILQLKERRMLALDDSLAKYLPSFPHARDVTLRQLLNQVSGLPDYFDVKGSERVFATTPGSIDKVAAYTKGPLHFSPGTQWQYSNTNYYVLGRVIEVVSHQQYDTYVREQLFARAGMPHSDFVGGESKLSDFAIPYSQGTKTKGAPRTAPPILQSWAGGAGAIVSTVGDLAAWDTALATGKIVTADDYALMSRPFVLTNGSLTAYGMGLGIDESNGHKRIWHAGLSNGSATMNASYPADKVDIIVFANSDGANPGAIEAAVFETIFPNAAASGKPGAGENLVMRPRVLHFIDGLLHGTIRPNEMSPQFQKMATPDVQQHIAQQLAPLGTPKALVFVSKGDRPGATRYTYRIQFATKAMTVMVVLDNRTKILNTMGIERPR